MAETLGQHWSVRVARCRFHASVAFDDEGLALGHGTVLLAAREKEPRVITLDPRAAHDRMVALLAVAGLGVLAKEAPRHIAAALDDWRRGDKALAAIRLAFARLPTLADTDAAYPLFLAEHALDAGLTPRELMRELGFAAAIEPLLKFPGQARMPKGSGRPSGRFAGDQSGGVQSATGPERAPTSVVTTGEDPARASVVPVFFDTTREKDARPKVPLEPKPLSDGLRDGRALDLLVPGAGVPLPFPAPTPPPPPPTTTEEDKRDGPACPPMRPDRPNGVHPAGDREEHRVAQIVNAESPTPKSTPETPDIVSQAYYLARDNNAEVAFDDCKRTASPVPSMPDLRKGDMVEVKTVGAATVASFEGTVAQKKYDDQFERQIRSIRMEGKGRRLFTCVGSESNVAKFTEKYRLKNPEAFFVVCGGAKR